VLSPVFSRRPSAIRSSLNSGDVSENCRPRRLNDVLSTDALCASALNVARGGGRIAEPHAPEPVSARELDEPSGAVTLSDQKQMLRRCTPQDDAQGRRVAAQLRGAGSQPGTRITWLVRGSIGGVRRVLETVVGSADA
jgi:hypothetical protein